MLVLKIIMSNVESHARSTPKRRQVIMREIVVFLKDSIPFYVIRVITLYFIFDVWSV